MAQPALRHLTTRVRISLLPDQMKLHAWVQQLSVTLRWLKYLLVVYIVKPPHDYAASDMTGHTIP